METVKQRLIFWTERQKGVCVPAAHACELARLYRYLVLTRVPGTGIIHAAFLEANY